MQPAQKAPALPANLAEALTKEVSEGKLELPILPEVAHQVIRAISDDRMDARSLSEIIGRDQAMSAHLLRIANSAVYGGANPITSVQAAVSRLGMANLRQVAFLITAKSKVFSVRGFDTFVRQLFKHAFANALYCQAISQMRRKNADDGFMLGLMHDVGRPLLLQKIVDLQTKMRVMVAKEAVLPALDEHHAWVGAELARRWAMNEGMLLTIRHHHDPEPPSTCAESVFTVQTADLLTHYALGEREVTILTVRDSPIPEKLGLSKAEVEVLLARSENIRKASNELV